MEAIKVETIKYIRELKENFIRISNKQEQAILNYWGQTISPEFTEQDIWEQTRKAMNNA